MASRRMRSASASVLALLLFFSLSFAFLAALVAARVPHSHGHHAAYGNRHALHSMSAKLKLHSSDHDESEFELLRVDVGSEFQISVRVGGEKQYLYSDGEKVKATSDPDSVGVRRTIWVAVLGITPASEPFSGAFSIQNKDTGARLYYDEERQTFFGAWVEGNGSPISGWRLWASESGEFKLQNVPAGSVFVDFPGNDHPQIFKFHFLPSEEELEARRASAVAVRSGKDEEKEFELLSLSVGTEFQIAVTLDGEKQYLYSEGEKVKTTSDPDSVGVRRTVWLVVPGVAPLIPLYAGAVAIQNKDTGARLYYDAENESFYGDWVEGNGSSLAGWRIWESTSNSGHFKLQNVPAGSVFVDFPGNDKPRVFHIIFVHESEKRLGVASV